MARKSHGNVKTYPVGLSGESNYQGAICVCREGEPVSVFHEIGNPYDDDALVVVSQRNETIGYISKSSWLRDAIHEEGRGCDATILSIEGEPMGVVIGVQLNESELDVRDYDPADRDDAAGSSTGCLALLVAMPLTLLMTKASSFI